ncbi:hypothetical protein P7228_04375 [Altererythrobacter arenosus]|uniref:DedA family protein n=1 Tax=Altererythrobacter arenosus TaxID=3032592 RepID=A0ABY8FU69_9SPHN|nr:hypothetical protein [Altererythrobacter sp. CAU 1644]WFL78307.1 hypothetical protein P7228_04375 [Altererythrobacter sp. CAU 1644]
MASELLLFFLAVFAINLLPAFGPPTWSIIVLFGINTDLPLAALVGVGALGAALGRLVLAYGFRFWGEHVSDRLRANLAAAREAFERRRRNTVLALGLFALSPLPSAQLFAAAGLAGVKLVPFTLAFFAGRLVSYSIYGGSARLVERYSLGDAFKEVLTSPVGIGLQLILLAGLVMLPRIDWARWLGRK